MILQIKLLSSKISISDKLELISLETQRDQTFQNIKDFCFNGWPSDKK